jgi:hypothetical protein
MTFGVYALVEDRNIITDACGKTYHVWKFSFLNLGLWIFSTVTYCVWQNGGEGARARALVLMIFFSAFFVWGVLTMQNISEQCSLVLENQYNDLHLFHRLCILMNGITALLFIVHESWLGQYMQADLTLKPDVLHKYNAPLDQPRPPTEIPGPMPSSISGPSAAMLHSQHPPTDLSPQNAYEYDKIMQNKTSASTTLPDVAP